MVVRDCEILPLAPSAQLELHTHVVRGLAGHTEYAMGRRLLAAVVSLSICWTDALRCERLQPLRSLKHHSTCRHSTTVIMVEEKTSLPGLPSNADSAVDKATALVGQIKSNAALFAAFAYGGLALPGTLTVSESSVTSIGTSISRSRPIESDMVKAFIVLDASTLALMLVSLSVAQLLLYRINDGTFGSGVTFSGRPGMADGDESETTEPERALRRTRSDSVLGVLTTQYGLEFFVARWSFVCGVTTLLAGVTCRLMAVYADPEPGVAQMITAIFGAAAVVIGGFLARAQLLCFSQLGNGGE